MLLESMTMRSDQTNDLKLIPQLKKVKEREMNNKRSQSIKDDGSFLDEYRPVRHHL